MAMVKFCSFDISRNRWLISVILLVLLTVFAAACNKGSDGSTESADDLSRKAEKSLEVMQVNLQKNLLETVTVLAVVDNTVYQAAEGEETITPEQQKDERLRRERLVRASLTSNLVRNTKLRIVNPPQALIDEFYAILKSKNANALSSEEAKKAGEALGVMALITAFLEDEGKKINVVATQVADGKVIFNETLIGWNFDQSEKAEESGKEGEAVK